MWEVTLNETKDLVEKFIRPTRAIRSGVRGKGVSSDSAFCPGCRGCGGLSADREAIEPPFMKA